MSENQGLRSRLRTHSSFFRYLLVGGGTSVMDLSVFTLLSVVLAVPEVPANVCSTVITLTVSYFVNRAFVFRSPEPPSLRGFLSFAGVTMVSGLLIQSAIIWGIVHSMAFLAPDLGPALVNPCAKTVAMGVGAVCNYLGYRVVFNGRQRGHQPRVGE